VEDLAAVSVVKLVRSITSMSEARAQN